MAKQKQRYDEDLEELDAPYEGELNLESFLDDMEKRSAQRRKPKRGQPAWKRIEERSEERWLREQLSDWEDFNS